MTNSKQEYNDFVRANLPGSIRYDSVRNRYVTANGKYFVTYKEAKWYVDYLTKFGTPIEYYESGIAPNLVLDYSSSTVFKTPSFQNSFDDVVTATRTGLATQLDASGNLVWNAHNLLTYSEDFSNAAWLKLAAGTGSIPVVTANQAIAPDGTLTADQVVFDCGAGTTSGDTSRLFLDVPDGFESEAKVWIRTDSGSDTISLVNQTAQTNAVVTDEWQLFTVSNNQTSPNFQIRLNGDVASGNTLTVYIWGAHVYRSDLGGMAPVPLTRRVAGSTTYVPTTSAAVYLPREEAYAYVSGSLAGPYYQKESDARTNLVTYSEDFTDASWAKVNAGVGSVPVVTANQGISPSGETTADRVQFDLNGGTTAGDVSRLRFSSTTVAASTGSFWVKSFDGTPYTIGFNVGSTLLAVSVTSEWQRVNATFSSSGATAVDIQLRGAQTPTNSDTADILLWGAQHEEDSTPTSYIPTSGSTVTRSADSTTIAAGNMPWPTPTVIGTNLDDDFSSYADQAAAETAGYAFTGCTFDAANDQVDFSGVSANFRFDTAYTSDDTAGRVYKATVTVSNYVSGSLSFQDAFSTVATVPTSNGTHEFIFVKSAVSNNVRVVTADFTGSLDNISVKEINPLALSFQMEGLVTYADNDSTLPATAISGESTFYAWNLDNSNYLAANLHTGSTRTGSVHFRQEATGVLDEVSDFNSYSPGINVPFNIASRHGSTFINGAVDGTALTADTTPTALPDLSATTFDLAPTFNGFIKEFRVWADDIGDAGIAEAST